MARVIRVDDPVEAARKFAKPTAKLVGDQGIAAIAASVSTEEADDQPRQTVEIEHDQRRDLVAVMPVYDIAHQRRAAAKK